MPLLGTSPVNEVSLQVLPHLQDSTTRVIASTAYTSSNINHLKIRLYTVNGGTESVVTRTGGVVEADVLPDAFSKAITFSNLHYDTDYRIRAYAYKATGVATSDLISDDTASYVDVSVGGTAHPMVASVPVKLLGNTFDSLATSSFNFTNGSYSQGNATMSVGSTTPPD